jgi:hypothetical protein
MKLTNMMVDTARAILDAATPESKANAFGSIGELDHSLRMAEKWGGDWTTALAQALVRVAGQRNLNVSAVFVWDEVELSHRLDPAALQKICSALLAS